MPIAVRTTPRKPRLIGLNHVVRADRVMSLVQYIATAMCSIAVTALALAAFLPAVAGCCNWVKGLAVTGGVFMLFFVLCELAAVVLAYVYVRVSDELSECNNQTVGLSVGLSSVVRKYSFWLAVQHPHGRPTYLRP